MPPTTLNSEEPLKVLLRREWGQVVRAKIYKGQIYIKYDAPNTYI